MDPTASLFCCGRSPRNSYRRLSLRSTRRSVWGIDLSSLRTDEDFLQVLTSVLTAIARVEITPAEGAQIAERVDARLRASRRLPRLLRRPAIQTSPVRPHRIP